MIKTAVASMDEVFGTHTDHAVDWLTWRRRHQTRARWFHQRTRLNRDYALVN
ncbi:hypothetical protein [Micromonospora sp. LOL_023]|uniref:hypothetical protein n=1 Tax=Micromonospora sp. LOL_023 TaxID=3345418 RepID=UPI003A875B6D